MTTPSIADRQQYRHYLVLAAFGFGLLALLWRVVDLQWFDRGFLQGQADARHLRTVSLPAHRGMITDRNGEPLAVSTPVDSVWANPQELVPAREYLQALAKILELDIDYLQRLLGRRADREFVYLRRHVPPATAAQVRALDAPGVYLQREYRRYYPDGEVVAHLIGFTDIDDRGQEGLELAYDDWLSGADGAKRVLKDGRHHVIADVELIRPASPGRDLRLSIDRRIQYQAYRELKSAVQRHRASSGSVVVLDAVTGEVLAMVNQPSFNPNNRHAIQPGAVRNRAVTDVLEPGSTMKPFTIAAALQSGQYDIGSTVNTAPGYYRVGSNTVRDEHDNGRLDLAGIIRKSSNVGASKIALSLDPEQLWRVYSGAGFGTSVGTGFPGEVSGVLASHHRWQKIEQATLAFGYGISVTPLQLARAYGLLANEGRLLPVSFLHQDELPRGRSVLDPAVVRSVRRMMEAVVSNQGTAPLARVPGYRVAGKTGTVHKATAGGYAEDRYNALFVGMAPASDPRLVVAVVINDPRGEDYFGGKVAGPVFSRVMSGALRLLNLPPDAEPAPRQQTPAPLLRQAAAGGPA
ncbi:penicillin-binding protein 3 [Thiohalobacter sp. COW1]|uniref:Peptidoglycan D,D-transpeptidase FtsI n=1 Tax=Thiohalobacter thiocyanaticus TaxID=585455 RepID=A0A1Z4VV23_9GAMM|nr:MULTISPECIES: penicillin-binding protein 2 [Thiohalobacter]BAZ95044.1 cell division protein FtsI/penicillin-binding protein 2 [Thiohalobacter thiocyanaticus]BCO33039.1 penicillin-binding protein 3 [Thiohalobacter sp. COW1]